MPRDPRYPLAPPEEFARWRELPGMVSAEWRGRRTWVCSRYEDIRAALVDPRLSADTIPDSLKVAAGDSMPVIFPRTDDPEHNRLRRMMTSDFTFRRAEAMRPDIQRLVDGFLDDIEDHKFFQQNSTAGLDARSSHEEKSAAIANLFGYMCGSSGSRGERDLQSSEAQVDH
jgi:cytochrome P450